MLRFATFFIPVLLILFYPISLFAQEKPEEKHPLDIAKDKIDQLVESDKKEFANNPDILLQDSIIANRKTQTVTIHAVATSVNPSDPIEFWFTTASSGKDYESLAIAFIKPSDVHKALEFIGLKAGLPVNYDQNRHWSRGPRVVVNYTFDVDGKPTTVRAEELMLDVATNQPLSSRTFMFTGSATMPDENNKPVYAADVVDTRPILPNYNDPAAVLDTPLRSMQSAVYGSQRINPKYAQKVGSLITITITPAPPAEQTVSRDIQIITHLTNNIISYDILDNQNKILSTNSSLAALTSSLAQLIDGKTDLFVTIKIDGQMRATDARKLYTVIQALESEKGLRIDPSPEKPNLFHRAFFPDEQWRKREDRLGEPFELHLSRQDGKLTGKLERVIDNPDQAGIQPTILQTFDAATPEICQKSLTDNASQWSRVIFVYPPADLTYAELTAYILPVIEQYPRVFIFSPEGDPTTQPTTLPAQ